MGEVPLGNHYGMCHECVKLYLDLNATVHYRMQCSSPLASWDLLEEDHSTDKTGFVLNSGPFLIVILQPNSLRMVAFSPVYHINP